MHKLINQLTLHDLKEHAKLLGKYLDNDLGIKINHSSVLNLAARGFGFKDYNTIKSYLDKMTECYVFTSTIKDIPLETILRCMQYVSQYVSLPELPIPGEEMIEDEPSIAWLALTTQKYGIFIQNDFSNPENIVATINKQSGDAKVYMRHLDIDQLEYIQLLEKYKIHFLNLTFVRTLPEKELDNIPFALLSQRFGAKVQYVRSIGFDKRGENVLFSSEKEKIEYLENVIARLHRVIETGKFASNPR